MRLVWIITKFVILAAVLAAIAAWLADQPGRITLDWRGWHVDSSAAFLAFVIFILSLLVWKVGKLFFWLRYNSARRMERRLRVRQQDGLRLLTTSLNALASQDLRIAAQAQSAARKKLGNVPLITWIGAQIATAKHDYKTAGSAYLALTQEPSAANLGWRGLMASRQSTGAIAAAQLQPVIAGALADKRIARQAYVHEARFAAAARSHDWEGLRLALADAEKHRALTRARLRQVEQVTLLARGQALQVIERVQKDAPKVAQKDSQARLLLERAYRLAPDFPPSALAYIDALLTGGDRPTAGKIIAAAWLLNPSAALLERFEAAYENETALARLQRFERFGQKRQDDLETQLAMGQLSLAAELYGKARTHIEKAQELQATARGNQLLADLTLATQKDAHLAHLYARRGAAEAPVDAGYQCQVCSTTHAQFHFLCESCGAFATLVPVTPGKKSLSYLS